MLLQKAKMILRDQIFTGDLRVKEGKIQEIGRDLKPLAGEEVKDIKGDYLAPGFIDVHIHGAGGADAMDGKLESLHTISKHLAAKGTTEFLATTLSGSREDLTRVLETAAELQGKDLEGAKIFGVHMEGPYFDVVYKGAQNEKYIKQAGLPEMQHYLGVKEGLVKLVSLSPNAGNMEVLKYLVSQNVVVSVGHSAASFEEVKAGIAAGLSHATHCFNGMKGFTHRDPGVVGAVLTSEEVMAEVIFDGIHVHPEAVRLLIQTKGVDKVACITDSMSATGLPCGRYKLGELDVEVKDSQARLLSNGALAGSVLTMDKAFRHLLELGYSLVDAVKMTSQNVAKEFSLNSGEIRVGKDANLIVMNQDFEVLETMVSGKTKFVKGDESK